MADASAEINIGTSSEATSVGIRNICRTGCRIGSADIDSSSTAVIYAMIFAIFFACALVTSSGLAAILDCVPNHRRGFATSISFFLNVAIGLGTGPAAVALAARSVFPGNSGLAPALLLISTVGCVIAAAGSWVAIAWLRAPQVRSPRSEFA